MSNRLILPAKYEHEKRANLQATFDSVREDIQSLIIKHEKELVMECLKDLNGGLMPAPNVIRKFLQVDLYHDGKVYKWKHQEMLFVARPKVRGNDTAHGVDVQIGHKKLYLPEPEPPPAATN